MSDTETSKIYKAEYAKSGRAKCKGCKEKIAKGCLRIGKEVMGFGGYPSVQWRHAECFRPPRKGIKAEEVHSLRHLKPADQQIVRDKLFTKPATAKKKGTKRKASAPLSKRSMKKLCRLPAGWQESKVSDLKNLCAERSLAKTGRRADYIERLERWQSIQDSLDPVKEAKEKKQYEALAKEFSEMTTKQMKELLEINRQKKTGTKAELVERCADAKLYGCLPLCDECGGGRMQVRYPFPFGHGGQGDWFCKGYFDDGDFVPCYNKTSDEIERPKWRETAEEEDDIWE